MAPGCVHDTRKSPRWYAAELASLAQDYYLDRISEGAYLVMRRTIYEEIRSKGIESAVLHLLRFGGLEDGR